MNKEKIYFKKFNSREEASQEYKRYDFVCNKVKNAKLFSIPKLVKKKDNKILFEFIDGQTLQSIKNSSFSIINPELFFKIGSALAEFHLLLNSDYNSSNIINIHGDFFPNNIIINKNKGIIFLDFNKIKYFDSPLKDLLYRDLAVFGLGIIYKYPLNLFYLRYRKLNKVFFDNFIKGYTKESGILINYNLLVKYQIKILEEELLILSRINFLSFIFWYLILKRDIRLLSREKLKNYSFSHFGKHFGKHYDFIYKTGSPEYYIYDFEKKIIEKRIFSRLFNYSLNFACGTGRFTNLLLRHSKKTIGIDISRDMIEEARLKKRKIKYIVGDLVLNDNLIEDRFDLILSFRFFLNAENELRKKILKILNKKITNDGIFIFNNHGNKNSLRKITRIYDYFFPYKRPASELSEKEIKKLLKNSNFKIIDKAYANFLPKVLLRLPFKLGVYLDRILIKIPILNKFSINIIYFCKKNN